MWIFADYITFPLLDFNTTVFVLIFITLRVCVCVCVCVCVVISNFSAISIHCRTQHEARELNLISGKNY